MKKNGSATFSIYRVEWQIETVSKNAVFEVANPSAQGFDIESIHLEHWDFSFSDGWTGSRWIATSQVSAQSLKDAVNIFYHKLGKIIPKIAFVSQCYIDFVNQPYSALKDGSEIIYFRNIFKDTDPGLMFRDDELKALQLLMRGRSIPSEFFLYWNDAVNTVGYNAKLQIMFAALEALVKYKMGASWEKRNLRNVYREKIIGKKLLEVFYAPGHSGDGLRNRLIHGEYLSGKDLEKNYVELLHKGIVSYFNSRVLRKRLVETEVKSPQRSIFPGPHMESCIFARAKLNRSDLSLKNLLIDFGSESVLKDSDKYELTYNIQGY